MTIAMTTRIRHGMASCGAYGCPRPECRAAASRHRKRLAHDRRNGIQATVSATRAANHARRLNHAGMSSVDIAARAGVSNKTVGDLVAGRCTRLYRDTAAAVLGVAFPQPGYRPNTDGLMDATAARRRLRALTACGYTLPVMAAEIGVTPETIGCIRQHRRHQVRISLNLTIADAYERLRDTDPHSLGVSASGATRAKRWAEKNGWPPPIYWDDDTIIDPHFVPATVDSQRKSDIAAWRAVEIQHLGKFGVPDIEIAERLGVTPSYVRDQLRGDRLPGTRGQRHLEAA